MRLSNRTARVTLDLGAESATLRVATQRGAVSTMIYSVPTFMYFWGPALVVLALWLMGRWSRKLGVAPGLGSDIDGYTAADARGVFEYWGERGRSAYRHRVLVADAAFAAFYGLVGLVLVIGLVQRGQPLWLALACGGPWMLGALFDIAEGVAHARMLDRFPAVEEAVAARASLYTRLKFWLFVLGILGVAAALWFAYPRNVLVAAL